MKIHLLIWTASIQSARIQELGGTSVIGVITDILLERYGKNTKGTGWYSFDQKGVHFIGLNNVMDLKAGGMGLADNMPPLTSQASGKPTVIGMERREVFERAPKVTVHRALRALSAPPSDVREFSRNAF
jgi:hypothetical protein